MSMVIRLKQYNVYALNKEGYVANARLIYHVDNIASESTADILSGVRSAAASIIEQALRDTVEMVEMPRGADCCDVAVNYVEASKQAEFDYRGDRQIDDEFWSFDASTGETTAVTALSQVAVVNDGTTALSANVADMIGWNGKTGAESECAGVSIITPSLSLNCRKTVAAATAQTTAFVTGICGYLRKYNTATFHGFGAGQVLFVGASIGETYYNNDGIALTDVNYRFAVRANEAARSVGGLTIPAKNGWDYAWTVTAFDPVAKKMKTRLAVVSRVYDTADLTGLGIG